MLQKQKDKRIAELPRIRPADMIDISEEHLLKIQAVFNKEQVQGVVKAVSFFFQIRKNPYFKRISSTLARDPQGTCRLPKETFQQVFDRMEKDLSGKTFGWDTIVEYFTRRGKPLTKEEIGQLRAEDLRLKEE